MVVISGIEKNLKTTGGFWFFITLIQVTIRRRIFKA
jgi:hypothetical protein